MLLEKLHRSARRRKKDALRRWVYGRAFSGSVPHRALLVSFEGAVARGQIDPFHAHAKHLSIDHGVELREVPVEAYLRGERPAAREATLVCFQTAFDLSRSDLLRLMDALEMHNPGAPLVYLDWMSPLDARLAETLDPYVVRYVKKHVFRERARYHHPTLGDTNLVDHYSRRFGILPPATRPRVPDGFFAKLVLGPSFVTADYLRALAAGPSPVGGSRPIDVHARFGADGPEWYRRMRTEAIDALGPLDDLAIVKGAGAHPIAYMRELRASKLCVSPFGYGEICWRDFEAVVQGAVLVKPDVSHVDTEPDVFVPNETYVPVRWDLADLEEKVRWLLTRPRLRDEIAANAFGVLHDYVREARFVARMAPILRHTERPIALAAE